ncbi:MAG TPA: exodeoxyribonuclease V subunit gamma [Euzebyales bacterium]
MLHIHRAERADQLVGALADVLREPLADPLATEVVAVPSQGIERWISQELSRRLGGGALGADGVCANVAFPFPGRLIRNAVAAGSGIDPEDDPWLPGPLTWPLLAIVDEDPKAPMLGPLRAHVGAPRGDVDDIDPSRRLSAVRHLADLFDTYGVHRPEMVVRWREGVDVGPDGTPLSSRHRWQPALWRAVRERIDLPSFAERRASAIDALCGDGDLLDLPPRLAMFGLTTLPATYLRVIAAIGAHRDVHLLLLHPSHDLWDRVAAAVAVDLPDHPATSALPLRDDDPTAVLPRNPLLRSWGRDIRELQLTAPLAAATLTHHDVDEPADDADRTLLQRLQHDVRADRHPGPRTADDRPRLSPDDRSVQVHDCHGRLRQVEVLRDAILHLLADDPTIELRDIIVMCPDIEVFAPLVTAVFGAEAVTADHRADADAHAPDAPPPLRVRLADRALRRTNPVLEVISRVLELIDARMTASEVLDLVARPPVRGRFGFTDDDLDALETWIGDLQIRWGFDADHRRRHGLPPLDAHTWAAGMRRLLLGAAMADEDLRLVGGVAPYDGLEGHATDLAGRLAELVARLDATVGDLAGARPIDAWRDAIVAAADRLTATSADDVWQRLQLHRILVDLVDEATTGGGTCPVDLSLAELRVVLAAQLAGRPSITSHRTGDLTFSTLVPMRSVPHRVVCLLGMDDGVFPRSTVPDSDDLLGLAPRVGDRDPRSEDRQLLLDALMAATDTLVVTYAGRDVRTNEDRQPAVPVDELLDMLDRTVAVDDGRPRDHVITRHPLADHDPRNFVIEDARSSVAPWGFDTAALAAARARVGERTPPRPFIDTPLPDPPGDTIALEDLVDFLTHPARAFVRRRLGLSLPGDDAEPTSEAIPSTLRGLDAWRVGDAIVQAWLDGEDAARAVEVVRARGLVPPGDLATADMQTVTERARRIISLCERIGIEPATPRVGRDVDVTLPDGRRLTGTVADTVAAGVLSVGYSKVSPKRRLATWAQWLALVVFDPTTRWKAVTVGRHAWRSNQAQAGVLEPVRLPSDDHGATALHLLQRLVDLFDRGMRAPIPLYCDSSAKSAEQRRRGEPPTKFVDKEWETTSYAPFPREDVDPYHLLVLGGQIPTEALFAERCIDADEASWVDDDDRRLVAYAWRLWEPILDTEQTRTL